MAGDGERLGSAHAFFGQRGDYFRNHIACAAHDDGVAHAHIFAARFVFIVQRRIGHRGAAHKHRRELGHRRELARAPDLHIDRQHRGQLLLRGVFVRHRPARLAAGKAQALLQRQAVHFVDHAVNVKAQALAQLRHTGMKTHQRVSAHRHACMRFERQAPGFEGLQYLHMRAKAGGDITAAISRDKSAQAISEKAQRPLGRNAAIELAHGTRRRIARINKDAFVFLPCGYALGLALIQRIKISARHINLAAHF